MRPFCRTRPIPAADAKADIALHHLPTVAYIFALSVYLSVGVPASRTVATPVEGVDTREDQIEALRLLSAGNTIIIALLAGVLFLQVRTAALVTCDAAVCAPLLIGIPVCARVRDRTHFAGRGGVRAPRRGQGAREICGAEERNVGGGDVGRRRDQERSVDSLPGCFACSHRLLSVPCFVVLAKRYDDASVCYQTPWRKRECHKLFYLSYVTLKGLHGCWLLTSGK